MEEYQSGNILGEGARTTSRSAYTDEKPKTTVTSLSRTKNTTVGDNVEVIVYAMKLLNPLILDSFLGLATVQVYAGRTGFHWTISFNI